MATSLVAAIEAALDLEATLVEGHNGIYEVSVDGEIVYTNGSQCGQGFPADGDIVEKLGQFIGVTPRSVAPPQAGPGCGCGPADAGAARTGCCGPADAGAASTGCCGPADGATKGKGPSSGCC